MIEKGKVYLIPSSEDGLAIWMVSPSLICDRLGAYFFDFLPVR